MIIIHNPTNAPIKDYPIENKESKEVLLWSILPGETLEFPDNVGTYLLNVYGFLQEVMTEDQIKERKAEEKKKEEGRVFTQVKVVKAEGEVIIPPNPQTGFTNDNMQPSGDEYAVPPVSSDKELSQEQKDQVQNICPEPTCRQVFKKEQHLKVHYALKHFQMPS